MTVHSEQFEMDCTEVAIKWVDILNQGLPPEVSQPQMMTLSRELAGKYDMSPTDTATRVFYHFDRLPKNPWANIGSFAVTEITPITHEVTLN